MTDLELAEICQKSHVSVTGCNTRAPCGLGWKGFTYGTKSMKHLGMGATCCGKLSQVHQNLHESTQAKCEPVTSNNIAITPIIPTNPLFPPCLQPQRPYHVGEDITEVGRGTRFIRVEDRNDIYYWITCCMDNTGVEFSM